MIEKIERDVRPWGKFHTYAKNEKCTVKILTVQPNEMLSLQKHKMRDELWLCLSGVGRATIDKKEIILLQNDIVQIKKGELHRLENKEQQVLKILEISTGFFDEEDNERIEDIYGRAKDEKK